MKIAIWSCGGTGNLGDDLCYLGVVELCRQRYGDDVETARIFRLNNRTLPIVNGCDRLLIGGGRLIDKNLYYVDALIRFQAEINVPCEFVGIGIEDCIEVRETISNLHPESWHVRDRHSLRILREANVSGRVSWGPDLSGMIPMDKQSDLAPEGAINLINKEKAVHFEDDLATRMRALGMRARFVAFNSTPRHSEMVDGETVDVSDSDDSDLSIGLQERVASDLIPLIYRCGIDDPVAFAQRISSAKWMICERLHAAILAVRFGIPFRAIAYHDKVTRFLSDNGLADHAIGGHPLQIFDAAVALERETA